MCKFSSFYRLLVIKLITLIIIEFSLSHDINICPINFRPVDQSKSLIKNQFDWLAVLKFAGPVNLRPARVEFRISLMGLQALNHKANFKLVDHMTNLS